MMMMMMIKNVRLTRTLSGQGVYLCLFYLTFCPFFTEAVKTSGLKSFTTLNNSGLTSFNNSDFLIQFHRADVQSSYKSSSKFDPKGMEHLYAITNMFLDLIQPKEFPADMFVNNSDDLTVILLNNKEELLHYYIGLVAVACLGLLLALVLPIIGLIFCLCRCAGRCGAHPEPYEKRYDSCKRMFYGVTLSLLVIVVLFGIVCGFVTNEYMEQGIDKLPENLNNSLDDVSLYIKNTKNEMNTLLIVNFLQLQAALDSLLDRSGDIVKARLTETSKASAIENLTHVVEGLHQVHTDLVDILDGTKTLHEQVKQLDHDLEGVRSRLQNMLNSCSDSLCDDIRKEYGYNALTVTSSLYKLPDISEVTQRIADFLQNNIEAEVKKGKQSLDQISYLIQEAVNKTIPEIKAKLRQAGMELKRHSSIVADVFDKVNIHRGKKIVHHVEFYSEEYGKIRYYVGLGLCCAVLLITMCFTCGLFCGFCGQKPHAYGNDTCSRVTGANFLIAGVYLVFLFSLFLMTITTVFFLIGGIVERVACDPIQDPKRGEIFQVADTFLPFQTVYPDKRFSHLLMSDIIRKCHQNHSLYNVLQLESVFNLTEVKNYKEHYKLDNYVQQLKDQISLNPAVLILTDQARHQLRRLADSEFAKVDFDTFVEILTLPVTPVSLVDVQTKLKEVIAHLEITRPMVASSLVHEANILSYLQKEIVVNITKTMATKRGLIINLQSNILFNKTSFHDLIYELLNQTEQAQIFIQTKGRQEIIKLADEFTANFTELLDEYANHVEDQVENIVGQCGPMSLAFNASVVSICQSIISPFNGFWASIGWCVLLFIPSIVFSVLLSSLYRKTDPYTGPLVESDSMYETYRDNIPLANVKKKRRRGQQETYENRNGYIPDYMLNPSDDAAHFRREAYPQSGQNSRYSRMESSPSCSGDAPFRPSAPMSWNPPDYCSNSNLGSPDYERPPPYYYPGPNA